MSFQPECFTMTDTRIVPEFKLSQDHGRDQNTRHNVLNNKYLMKMK